MVELCQGFYPIFHTLNWGHEFQSSFPYEEPFRLQSYMILCQFLCFMANYHEMSVRFAIDTPSNESIAYHN